MKSLSSDAALGPIRGLGAKALTIDLKDVPPISYKHFKQALRVTKPSVAEAELSVYVDWNETYGGSLTRGGDLLSESTQEDTVD
mgnify:FL=1